MSDSLRLFIACELSEEMKKALLAIQGSLKGQGLQRLRWVRPEAIHLTLKFLGETAAAKVSPIEQALASSCQGILSFKLTLGQLGTFGDRRRPRVIWVGLSGESKVLSELQGRVEEAMEGLGFQREARPFSPHLTLARVPAEISRSDAQGISEAIPKVKVPMVSQTIAEISLMRSSLGPGGAVYQKLAAFPLGDRMENNRGDGGGGGRS